MQDSFQFHNGILTVFMPKDIVNANVEANNVVLENTNTIEPIVISTSHTQNQPPVTGTWSSIVAKNIPVTEPSRSDNAQIIFNDDGSAT